MRAMEDAERKGMIRKTGRMKRGPDGTFQPEYVRLGYEDDQDRVDD
jgi:hypothetical protein